MVKPLVFKGDKKPKKRKHPKVDESGAPDEGGRNEAEKEGAHGDDTWVTADVPGDLVGPVIIVLPTEPPTCVACDANGSVFASPLENMVEADPATAEPHDVRQVWVANQVAGTESVSLKGHHGK
jgi:protein FRG1